MEASLEEKSMTVKLSGLEVGGTKGVATLWTKGVATL